MKKKKWIPKLFFTSVILLLLLSGVYTISEAEFLNGRIKDSSSLREQAVESLENLRVYGFWGDLLPEVTPLQAEAKPQEDRIIEADLRNRPLVQTVGEEDEIHGLIHLGLLEVETNKEQNLDRAKQLAAPTITRISMGDYYGSGAIISMDEENIILISNQHLLVESRYGEVIFFNGTKAEGEVIGSSEMNDVGFMKVKIADIPYEQLKELRYVSIDYDCYQKLGKGDEMIHIGSSDGAAKSIYEGTIGNMWWYVEEFDSYMIYNYCYAEFGMSGGGTFDAHGHYIGMITGGNGEESASLPLITIVEEYENITGRGLEFSVS